jgi:hypothetical protein
MLKLFAMIMTGLLWCTPVWAQHQQQPAVPGTYAGAGLPWSTAAPPQVIHGPGIKIEADGRQVDMLGISGGRWGATGTADEMYRMHAAGTEDSTGSRISIGWLGLLGLLGMLGARLRRRGR